MYKQGFFLDKPVGNNAFSYEKRINKKIYVPSLINAKIDDIFLGDKIAFEDFDFNNKLSTNIGLKNFYKIKWKNKYIYLFDNHNHAFYFWYLSRNQGIIGNNNTLIHIDEHSDIKNNNKNLSKENSSDLQKVFKFTNEVLNVGDYIVPAINEGIIGEVIQIRNTTNLEDYLKNKDYYKENIILNLDLDFFQPDLDFIDYDLKKKVILDSANKAFVITVATSPFFVDQNLAIKVFKDIFK